MIPPNDAVNRILAALGLEKVRSLKISATVNSAVTVVTEQYATGTQVDNLAAALETKEWVLVPRAGWLTDAEREAIADAAGRYVEGITPKAKEFSATLRRLLWRTRNGSPEGSETVQRERHRTAIPAGRHRPDNPARRTRRGCLFAIREQRTGTLDGREDGHRNAISQSDGTSHRRFLATWRPAAKRLSADRDRATIGPPAQSRR